MGFHLSLFRPSVKMTRTYLKKEKLLPSLHQTGHLFMLQIVLGMANSTPGNKNNKIN
jgi:hypothetical protein